MILTDNETKVDLLNNGAIATTIIKLLRNRPDQPVTVGVHGDWGAGKSSVLEMIETGLKADTKVLCLKFNGWRFQGFEDAKIALIEGIVTGLIESRPSLTKAGEAVKDVFRRIDWLKVAKKAGGLALTAFTGIPTPDQIQTVVATLDGIQPGRPSRGLAGSSGRTAPGTRASTRSLSRGRTRRPGPEREGRAMLTREHGISDARGWPDRLEQGRHGHYVALAERMLETYRAGAGKARLELHGEVGRIFADVADCPPKRVASFCKLLDEVSEYDEDSRGKAAKLRKEVFRLAAPRHPLVAAKDSLFENEESSVKEDVAKALGKTWPDIERSLFMDVIDYHRLRSFTGYGDAKALLSRYNVAQWQVRLYDATSMVVRASGDLKTIVRHAKLAGLMHAVEKDLATGEYVLTFDGPASVLRETRRYGVNMAMFLPTLAACGGWRMTADIQRNRGGFATRLDLNAGHLKVDSPPPEPFDSSVEAAFFKKWGGAEREGWRLSREDVILDKGQKVFIPDFTLRHASGAEVLLEIVGFWTPGYMARKVETLRQFQDSRILLAVAEQVGDGLPSDIGPTVRYKSGLKIKDVLAAVGQFGVRDRGAPALVHVEPH